MNNSKKEPISRVMNIVNNENVFFDDSVAMPSVNNRIKEISYGSIVWEDASDDDLDIENASETDLENLLWEIEAQNNRDDKLMERCRG